MRTLTLMMALSALTLSACGGSEEICGNGLDDDGNGLVDGADDACEAAVEDCTNGTDDDGDGVADCDDADCLSATECTAETCDNDIDDNGDGLIDCDDADCTDAAACNPSETWAFEGTGTATATEYTGTWSMTDVVLTNPNGVYNIGDELCTANYPHSSIGAVTATMACDNCEWSFSFAEEQAYIDSTGPLCDQWYDFADSTAENYFGTMSSPENFGLTTSYAYAGGTYTLAMFYYTDNGVQYTGWYPYGAAEYDSSTGVTSWYRELGEYAY